MTLTRVLRFCLPPLLFVLVSAVVPTAGVQGRSRPLLYVDLRIHLGQSGRPREAYQGVLAEIKRIWVSQAGICFVIEAVDDDDPRVDGLDLWFEPDIGDYNGYFSGPHRIRVRDVPDLAPAPNPSSDPAARTAAHELGHGLGLGHRQESDDNLMRSKTYGWHLGEGEIETARRGAERLGRRNGSKRGCPAPRFR